MRHSLRVALACVAAALAASVFAAGAAAQGRIEQTGECGGEPVTILVQPSNADVNWGAVQVVGGGHLIPLRLEFSLFNVTTNQLIFSEVATKGKGKVPPGQADSTLTCSMSFTAPASEFFQDEPIPPGIAPTDIVRFTVTALVIDKRR